MIIHKIKYKLKRILQVLYVLPKPVIVETVDPKWQWLGKLGIKTILNIGSNEGQFALQLRKHIQRARIYAFEPLPKPLEQLSSNFANDLNFQAFPYALGEEEGVVKMYLNEYSPSSSLLKMDDNHKKHFEFAKNEFEVEVTIKKLDSVAKQIEISRPLLITIDVQGFEIDVIKGGLNTIRSADIIITEVSYTRLYEHQPFFDDVYTLLISLGFAFVGNFEQLISPISGAVLQADAIFMKKNLLT
ncbi:MAG TPA: FkbM family methyltransferase [Chitinophagaceae bacterium]|nr:FkbM family methyltransferase [Chitinophagaceae bacterium]